MSDDTTTGGGGDDDDQTSTPTVKDPKPDRPQYMMVAAYSVTAASGVFILKALYELFFCVCGGGIF
ncbi:MAG: hypothetical protein HEP71_29060 [Roseivirga sp.]|nr:hypothetical protein [Roseivirga sp.]